MPVKVGGSILSHDSLGIWPTTVEEQRLRLKGS